MRRVRARAKRGFKLQYRAAFGVAALIRPWIKSRGTSPRKRGRRRGHTGISHIAAIDIVLFMF